jgi:hypothetical protein
MAGLASRLEDWLHPGGPARGRGSGPPGRPNLEQHLLVGIEVASSPIPEINSLGPTVIAADFGNNNGLVLGSVLADWSSGAPVQLACYVDGDLVGEGSVENLPGGFIMVWPLP